MLAIFCHNAVIVRWLGSGEDQVSRQTLIRCPDFLSKISHHHKLSWKSSRGLLEKISRGVTLTNIETQQAFGVKNVETQA